ncbi:transposase, partial [Streptomyces carminius]|uniref:transposase n=1 Tax=Streptomyces carminius TaxID=2665496 RepID=UPI001E3CA017
YKCAWYGRDLVVIDRFFPSSKLCGTCGTVAAKLPPNVRTWTCDCGATHDRDVNAARNIPAAGPAAAACGDGARPQRESSRTGRSSLKQEPQRASAGISRP